MANTRSFYTVGELAELVGGRVIGDPALEIRGVAGVAESRRISLPLLKMPAIWLRLRIPGQLLS